MDCRSNSFARYYLWAFRLWGPNLNWSIDDPWGSLVSFIRFISNRNAAVTRKLRANSESMTPALSDDILILLRNFIIRLDPSLDNFETIIYQSTASRSMLVDILKYLPDILQLEVASRLQHNHLRSFAYLCMLAG
jgi:hypothetical protein